MPGKPVTDQQVRLYMQDRPRHSQRVAAARAGFSARTARRIEADPRLPSQRRVERAKELLRHGDDTLAAIAAAVGFADQSHFTAAFRRETGLTPGRFRAAAR